MSTKTISLKDAAYRRLKAARRDSSESFSEVVMRATWPEDTVTARELLDRYARVPPFFTPDELDRIEAVSESDRGTQDSKWADR
jgi:predicted CopG family antitoxin